MSIALFYISFISPNCNFISSYLLFYLRMWFILEYDLFFTGRNRLPYCRYVQKLIFFKIDLSWEVFTEASLLDTRLWKQSNIILPFPMFCRCWCICWHLNVTTSWIVKSQTLVSIFNISLPNRTFGGSW